MTACPLVVWCRPCLLVPAGMKAVENHIDGPVIVQLVDLFAEL